MKIKLISYLGKIERNRARGKAARETHLPNETLKTKCVHPFASTGNEPVKNGLTRLISAETLIRLSLVILAF